MKRIFPLSILVLMFLFIFVIAGCDQQENSSSVIGTVSSAMTASGSTPVSQSITEQGVPSSENPASSKSASRLLEAMLYCGAEAVPPNHLYTFSDSAHLALIEEALLHKDRLPGLFSLRTPDYTLVLDYGAEQEKYALWLHDASGALMNWKSSSALYQFTVGYDQKLRSMIAEIEPISVYQGSSQVAINQVTEKKKQTLIREILSAANMQTAPWDSEQIDQSYRFVVDGSTYMLHIADDTYTLIDNSAKQYRLKKNDGVSLTVALGVHLLSDYGVPLGNQHVQRYCGYIYYTMDGRLFRMRENGTGVEQLLAKAENAGRLIGQSGSLYFFSGAPDSTVYQVQTDSRVAPLLPMATRVGDVLAITEKYIYYTTIPQQDHPVVTRRRSVHGKNDIIINQEKAEAAVVSAVSPSEDLLYMTASAGTQPGSDAAQVKLIKCFPDGKLITEIDAGLIDQLAMCGDCLVYRKTVSKSEVQIWAFDTVRATLRLLVESSDTGTGSADAGATSLSIVGTDDSEAMIYYMLNDKLLGSVLYRILPNTLKSRDQSGPKELVWNGIQMHKSLLHVDLLGGWLYYAILPVNLVVDKTTDLDSEKSGQLLSAHRCRLDGTSDITFLDGAGIIIRAVNDPLTIGRWIYFMADQRSDKPQQLQRYNTETGMKENLPNGLVLS